MDWDLVLRVTPTCSLPTPLLRQVSCGDTMYGNRAGDVGIVSQRRASDSDDDDDARDVDVFGSAGKLVVLVGLKKARYNHHVCVIAEDEWDSLESASRQSRVTVTLSTKERISVKPSNLVPIVDLEGDAVPFAANNIPVAEIEDALVNGSVLPSSACALISKFLTIERVRSREVSSLACSSTAESGWFEFHHSKSLQDWTPESRAAWISGNGTCKVSLGRSRSSLSLSHSLSIVRGQASWRPSPPSADSPHLVSLAPSRFSSPRRTVDVTSGSFTTSGVQRRGGCALSRCASPSPLRGP